MDMCPTKIYEKRFLYLGMFSASNNSSLYHSKQSTIPDDEYVITRLQMNKTLELQHLQGSTGPEVVYEYQKNDADGITTYLSP